MKYFLHKVQLHVSALDNGHLQVVQPEYGHYVENTLYSTNKCSCVRRVLTLYISYFIEHNGDDEPHDCKITSRFEFDIGPGTAESALRV